jgi:hypothetical protein
MQSRRQSARWIASQIWRKNALWIAMAAVSAIGVVVSAIFASGGNASSGDRVLPNIFLNLATAFLVAALIEIFSQLGVLIRVDRNIRSVSQLFGVESRGASVAVVLPKFDVKADSIWAKQTHGWSSLASHGQLIAPDQELIGVGVQADMVAASDLIAMFSVLGMEAPTVMWDDEALEHYRDPSSVYRTFISIGLASNALSMHINDATIGPRYFKLDLSPGKIRNAGGEDVTDGVDLAVWRLWLAEWHPSRAAIIQNELEWEPYVDEKWGLISKVVMPDTRKCVFLVAGMHSEGTRRMGDFIARNWKSILEWRDTTSDRRLGRNCFAAMVDILAGSDEAVGTRRRVVVDPANPHLDADGPAPRGGA